MKATVLFCVLAVGASLVSTVALADDPNDPVLSRSAAARARDKAIIRRLNQDELAHVRARDARYAEGWEAYRERGGRAESYDAARAEHSRAMADYARQRADYERQRAAWRHAVRMCESGHYEYCDG
jgi:hypothetical protein